MNLWNEPAPSGLNDVCCCIISFVYFVYDHSFSANANLTLVCICDLCHTHFCELGKNNKAGVLKHLLSKLFNKIKNKICSSF